MTNPPSLGLVELGARIRSARVAARLTQDDLAAAVGLNRRTVSRVELGHHAVSVIGLLAMAEALDVTPSRLLDRFGSDEAGMLDGRRLAGNDRRPRSSARIALHARSLRQVEHILQADQHRRVVRVGNTVRRPVMPWSAGVHKLLLRLEAEGFTAAPRFLGLDDQGREILSYIEGVCGNDGVIKGVERGAEVWALVADEDGLRAFARLLRNFHDATDGSWCHGDYTPWNVVWVNREPVGIIDWDYAVPGPPMDDVAYALRWCIPFTDDDECLRWRRFDAPPDRRRRLAIFAEAYGLPGPEGLFDAAIDRQRRTIQHARELAQQGIQPQVDWVADGALQVDEAVITWSLDHRQLFEDRPAQVSACGR